MLGTGLHLPLGALATLLIACPSGPFALLAAASSPLEGSLTIGNAANISRCLGSKKGMLVLQDCIHGVGAEWKLTSKVPTDGARMQMVFWSDPDLPPGTEEHCLHQDMSIRDCLDTTNKWSWNPKTLQIQLDMNGDIWCLGFEASGQDAELHMEQCNKNQGETTDDQNGVGAPAEQTWVMFPAKRPQIEELATMSFPLRSSGAYIMDSTGKVVKLAGVSWTGSSTEMLVNNGLDKIHIKTLAKLIKYMGFNSVRMSYSTSMHYLTVHGTYPEVPDEGLLAANPELKGLNALEIFDKCVEELTSEGLLVILNHNMMVSGWCCNGTDGNELWYGKSPEYTIDNWLEDLTFVAKRYKDNKRVIALEIFNEPRPRDSAATVPWWGVTSSWTKILGFKFADWRVAAAQGAVAVWKGDPEALVIVDGPLYSADFTHVLDRPMNFAQDCLHSRIVYAPHEYRSFWPVYSWVHHVMESFDPLFFKSQMEHNVGNAVEGRSMAVAGQLTESGGFSSSYDAWVSVREGSAYYLQKQGKAAVLVAEFGASTGGDVDNSYWNYVLKYFGDNHVNWCYWALDPIRYPKDAAWAHTKFQSDNTFGIFDSSRKDYWAVVGWKLQALVGIMPPASSAPKHMEVPGACVFEEGPNVEAAKQPTSRR
jgi:aryl-phospho-beta-D-glucosidase BglC (GH1 family)